jgi:predicted enzyme related to lactoylglutathione lyase
MAKVTGIGGVFFKAASDHKKLAEWYSHNLGIQLEPWGGAILRWTDDTSDDHGLTVWHVAEKDSDWFGPSRSSFMINYRIDDMAGMLATLQRNGVEILKGPESQENGQFAWILDPDGNKVELWEPMPRHQTNHAK